MDFEPPRVYERRVVRASDMLKGIGEPLYFPEDIDKTSDPLTRLFRKICIKHNITYPYFVQRYREYHIEVLDYPPEKIYNGVNNLKKPLYGKDNNRTQPLTSRTFKLYLSVLGLEWINLTLTLVEDDQLVEYKLFE